jgi:hypothetical protein
VPCRGRGDRARHRADHECLARALLVHHRSRAAHKPLTEALAPTLGSVEIGVGVFALNQRAQMARLRRDGASRVLGTARLSDRDATSSRSLGRDNATRMAYRDADALGLRKRSRIAPLTRSSITSKHVFRPAGPGRAQPTTYKCKYEAAKPFASKFQLERTRFIVRGVRRQPASSTFKNSILRTSIGPS